MVEPVVGLLSKILDKKDRFHLTCENTGIVDTCIQAAAPGFRIRKAAQRGESHTDLRQVTHPAHLRSFLFPKTGSGQEAAPGEAVPGKA